MIRSLLASILFSVCQAFALDGQIQIHDPSTVVTCEGKFYTYGTGGSSLVSEDGLVDGEVLSLRPLSFVVQRLTWSGHDFLENARNDTVWKKVFAEAKVRGTSVSLTVLNGLLTKVAQKYDGLE
jgi:hypothetical protein